MKSTTKPRLAVTAAVIVATGLTLGACSSSDDSASVTTTTVDATVANTDQTIVDIAAGNPDFSTLVAAVNAADLTETLSGEGGFTVFAPTNEAFEQLPAGTLDTLLKPENEQDLADILTYHVVPGRVLAADVTAGPVTTVNGAEFTVSTADGVVITDGQDNSATVVKTDLVASNGVIHVIDAVLLPPTESSTTSTT